MLHLWARKFKGIIGSEEGWFSASSISWQPVDLVLHSRESRFEVLSKPEGPRVFVGKGLVNSNRPLSDVNKGSGERFANRRALGSRSCFADDFHF